MRRQLPAAWALLLALLLAHASHGQPNGECAAALRTHLATHTKEASPYLPADKPDQLVFFLHMPRTAGRTFHTCFLKLGTPPAKRCPKAYDHLRIERMSEPGCSLLSSHDDFSVVGGLALALGVPLMGAGPPHRRGLCGRGWGGRCMPLLCPCQWHTHSVVRALLGCRRWAGCGPGWVGCGVGVRGQPGAPHSRHAEARAHRRGVGSRASSLQVVGGVWWRMDVCVLSTCCSHVTSAATSFKLGVARWRDSS